MVKRKCLHIDSISSSTIDTRIRCGWCNKILTKKEIKIFQITQMIRRKKLDQEFSEAVFKEAK